MGSSATKTDNTNLPAKLVLRRHFLNKYHAGDKPNVFDCCQGSGEIWDRLRKEYDLAGYWGVDLKPKKGRLKVHSARVLGQSGWPFTVVDIDTYGSPWKHWTALLPHVVRPLTVFLTIGQWQMGTDGEILHALGLEGIKVPPGISVRLHDLALLYLLGRCEQYGLEIVDALEPMSSGNARYLGVRLSPALAVPGHPDCSRKRLPV